MNKAAGCLGQLGPVRAAPRQHRSVSITKRAVSVVVRSGEGDRELESAFEKELRRRGLDAASVSGDEKTAAAAPRFPLGQSGSGQQQQRGGGQRPAPSFRGAPEEEDDVPPQLKQSRLLNAEGLEGLIPRGVELLKLGGTFFLAFTPFIIVVALAFGGIYAVFGDSFVHGGNPNSGPPPYYDVDLLLAEPTADPMIPLDLR